MTSVLLGDAHGISVVDFKPFLDGSAKQDVADAILDSFKRVGFVYLINHGIPEEQIKGMFDWVRVASFSGTRVGDRTHKMRIPSRSVSSLSRWKSNNRRLIPPLELTIEVCVSFHSFLETTLTWTAGYSAPGQEKIVQHVYDDNELKDVRAKAPDVKESFECGCEENAGMPNIWLPDGILPGFKEACTDFYWVRGS